MLPLHRRLFTRLVVAVVSVSLLSACVTKPNTRLLRKVKSAAIVGFVVVPQRDISLRDLDNTFKTAAKLYKLISMGLANERQWRVTPPEMLARSHTYQALFSRYGAHVLSGDIRASGILSQEEQVNLTPKERDNLRKTLGVDALVSVGFVLSSRQPVAGDGPDAPKFTAKITFDVYGGTNANSIWQISSLPNDKAHSPPLAPQLNFGPAEKDFASAIYVALATMLQIRKSEEAVKD